MAEEPASRAENGSLNGSLSGKFGKGVCRVLFGFSGEASWFFWTEA